VKGGPEPWALAKAPSRHRECSPIAEIEGGGKTCWAMSADVDLDGKELELEFVLERVFDSDAGTILSCLPGRLGLYSGEDEKLLLAR
jgi:hypothetical protein